MFELIVLNKNKKASDELYFPPADTDVTGSMQTECRGRRGLKSEQRLVGSDVFLDFTSKELQIFADETTAASTQTSHRVTTGKFSLR